MPPLALTQAKYAAAMFGISVNDVPGWLVAIAPSGIGVPVAFTPGLVPHCDVLTAAPLGEPAAEPLAGGLLDALLLHPAATSVPMTATSAAAVRVPGAVLSCPHLIPTSWWCRHEPSPLGQSELITRARCRRHGVRGGGSDPRYMTMSESGVL